jgi:hypothetical protein
MMLPPLGAIIVGPCPECEEMVVVFCGRVFALNKDTMLKGTEQARRSHLQDVLSAFLKSRVERLFSSTSDDDKVNQVLSDSFSENADEESLNHDKLINPYGNKPEAPISKTEIESFKDVDLRLIDNTDYFRAVFE